MLGAKYARAINKLEPAKNKIQVTDLTFAIFDALVPSEHLEKLTMEDVIHYRLAKPAPDAPAEAAISTPGAFIRRSNSAFATASFRSFSSLVINKIIALDSNGS